MKHWQRMDPQPRGTSYARDYRFVWRWYKMDGEYGSWPAPQNMPNAEPWRDRNGTWWWHQPTANGWSRLPASRALLYSLGKLTPVG